MTTIFLLGLGVLIIISRAITRWLDAPRKDDAVLFLRAGGHLGWKDWARASHSQKQAWLTAGEEVQAERVFQLAQGLSGPEGLADVISVVDHGATLDRLQLVQAVDRATARLRR